MTDSNEFNLATEDRGELKVYAANNLDLNLSMTMSAETMRTKIIAQREALGLDPLLAVVISKKDSTSKNEPRVLINIAKQQGKGGSEDVFVGVQGVGYRIPRALDIAVPKRVAEVLRNAVQTIVTQDDDGLMHHEKVHTYPFSIIREVA